MDMFIKYHKTHGKKIGCHRYGGFAIIDALFGMTIASVLAFVFIGSIMQASTASEHARDRLQAQLAMLEMYEVAYAVSQERPDLLDLQLCTESSTCHFFLASDDWEVGYGVETLSNQINRTWHLLPVHRDNLGRISTSDAIIDPNSLQIVMEVFWSYRGSDESESMTAFLYLDQ